MAIMDAKATFAYEKTVAGSANAVITGSSIGTRGGVISSGGIQIIDLGKAGDAVGQELTLKAYVGGTAIAGSGATVQVVVQTGGDNAVNSSGAAVDSNFHDLYSGPAISVGSATTGKGAKLFECRVPGGAERYLRAGVKVGTSATTAGTVNIFLTKDL